MVSTSGRLRRPIGVAAALVTAAGIGLAVPSVSTAAARPDLAVVSTSAPAKAAPGKAFTVRTKIRNAGTRKAAATTVEYYLSKDNRKGSGDRKLAGSARLKALIGGVSWDVSARVKVPSGTAPGSYYVLACVARDAGPARNDCKAPRNKTKVTGLLGPGTITGDLTLTDAGQTATLAWDRTSTVGIKIDVKGPQLGAEFADDGSSYSWTGTEVETENCYHRDRVEEGGGGFEYTGDPTTDDIYGHWTHTSRSSLRIGLFIYYDSSETITTCQGTTTDDDENLNVVSIKFEEVSRTASSITYRAESWTGELSTTSNWDEIDGTITFALN